MKLKHIFIDALIRAQKSNDYNSINDIARTMHNCGIKSIKTIKSTKKRSL